MRHHENIGKDDGGVEAEAADRLQRHLGREFGIVDEVEKPACLFPHGAIFRQVASGLAHHPEGRSGLPLSRKNLDERLGGGTRGQTSILN